MDVNRAQTLGEGLDRVMRYQLYKSIGLLFVAGLLYVAARSERQSADLMYQRAVAEKRKAVMHR